VGGRRSRLNEVRLGEGNRGTLAARHRKFQKKERNGRNWPSLGYTPSEVTGVNKRVVSTNCLGDGEGGGGISGGGKDGLPGLKKKGHRRRGDKGHMPYQTK